MLSPVILADTPEQGSFGTEGFDDPLEAILMIVRRHPMRADQIVATLGSPDEAGVIPMLADLADSGQLRVLEYRGHTFYASGTGADPS